MSLPQLAYDLESRMKRESTKLLSNVALVFALGIFLFHVSIPRNCIADDEKGVKSYAAKCASCHGAAGEGNTNEFADPLHGDLSLSELTKYIVEAMPEEDPDSCVGEEAAAVAKHVFDSFYSAEAQRKLTSARIELSRLTVRQYRQSVANLVGSFGRPLNIPDERGLEANYFASRNSSEKRRLAKQVDDKIDFGDGVPYFDPTDKYESLENKEDNKMNQGFSAYWRGGIIAPETGEYEFVVQSKNGFKLFINDEDNELIDREVRSDEVVDHKVKLYLIGGRAYYFKLEMFSYPKPPAKMRLLWEPPGKPLAVVPKSAFVKHRAQEVAVVSTKFPADDASAGYERGVDVSSQWDSATTRAAIEVAGWISAHIWDLARAKPGGEKGMAKVKKFCETFVGRAFVTELSDDDKQFYVGQHFDKELSVEDQVRRVVLMTLKSPRFLYPQIEDRDLDHEMAMRMGLSLWDSLPDNRLYKLADQGKLTNGNAISNEVHRMVGDPRSKQKLNSFFQYWLKTGYASEATKDKESFPDFDEQLVSDLKDSLFLYLDEVIWSERSDFRELFLADYLVVNERLAKFYDLELNDEKDSLFQKVKVDPKQRAGILTHPYLMTGLAYHKDSSPIHRGVFVAKSLLGRRLRQPPEDVEPLTEEFNPKMTTRERVEHQTKESTCMGCHSVINPLGFSLENFDAVGRFRTEEKKRPIDVSSVYNTPDGKSVKLNGARDLAKFLAENEFAQRSFIRQLFNHYAKQPIEAYGDKQLDRLHEQFVKNEFNVRKLLTDISLIIIKRDLDLDPES